MTGGWWERALCAEVDTELFFPEKGNSSLAAKKVCFACEVRGACLDDALARGERHGVWGGLSYQQRRRHPQWQEAA
jgi:WhiB family transcriptional regulator, redox-sensing transcriptional regulator